MDLSKLTQYEVIKDYYMEDMQSQATLLKHKKSGAMIVLLSNDDDNKVFNIGFRTPVTDDSGVPHIIEHTVLCGSKKYPVKDPFVELAKGSLNTFLNAITYPDKTVYPVASCNDKDFRNLTDIYLDAVFNPRIYSEDKIFMQEGWHYELDSPDGELTLNGVVYNEMKGALSSVDGIIDRTVMHSLFPDTTYGNESGGHPSVIPELTYETYLDFHRKYYHPSNSFIYFYGDMDMEEYLNYLDEEYLSKYDYLEVDSEIKRQEVFEEMRVEKGQISISDGESERDNTVISYNMVLETSLDKNVYRAFQVLDYALMDMPGAPLKQAILDAGIGKDVYSTYENGIYQPFYSFVARNANEEDVDRFKEIVDSTLVKIIEEGIDRKSLEASINNMEFKYRENDYGRYPKGLIIGLQMFDSWLYDKNEPFMHIEAGDMFDFLREQLRTSYYEDMLKKYLLDNTHKSMVVLTPKKGLTAENEQKVADRLAKIKNSMSAEEIDELIRKTKELKKYQETSSTPEELEVIPMIELKDISTEPRPIKADRKDICGVESVHHDYNTNGIGYLSLVFNNKDIPVELIPYLGLVKAAVSYLDTQDYTYSDLSNEINMHTGAIVVDEVMHAKEDGTYISTTEVNIKALYNKMPKAFELVDSIVFRTKFGDYKRLLEIIREIKARIQNGIMSSGDSVAALRSLSYTSERHFYKELYSGISYYKFIEDIEKNFEEKKEMVAKKLELVTKYIFRPENLIISYTCDSEHYFDIEPQIEEFKNNLYTDKIDDSILSDNSTLHFEPKILNEGLKNSSQVQYVIRTGRFDDKGYKFDGAMYVLRTILGYEYLWNKIRELGGAYGCSASFNKTGEIIMSSYRDPKLKETNDVYKTVPQYIREFEVDDRAMLKFIIGTISGMDSPLSASDAGARSFNMYISETTIDMLREVRHQVLGANVETIRACADAVEAALSDENICVVGNENKIEENKELFNNIVNLFE